jgi:hypothetical protein
LAFVEFSREYVEGSIPGAALLITDERYLPLAAFNRPDSERARGPQ